MELFGAEVRLRQMARLRNFVRKNGPRGFRAVLFRMVPKHEKLKQRLIASFRAVLFRMVPKPRGFIRNHATSFRAVLFRMVPKLYHSLTWTSLRFRTVLFRMVPKHNMLIMIRCGEVLELCCFEWFQNAHKS